MSSFNPRGIGWSITREVIEAKNLNAKDAKVFAKAAKEKLLIAYLCETLSALCVKNQN